MGKHYSDQERFEVVKHLPSEALIQLSRLFLCLKRDK